MGHTHYKRPESVLVVVYARDTSVLLLRRRRPVNFWQSVTGSLEWGETAVQAAHREIREETGLSSDGLVDCYESHTFEIFPTWRYRYASGVTQNLEHMFRLCLAKPVDVTLDETEHNAYLWLGKYEAVQQVSSYTNRDAILQWVPNSRRGERDLNA
jgi:dATP pyrophosphohydrolase